MLTGFIRCTFFAIWSYHANKKGYILKSLCRAPTSSTTVKERRNNSNLLVKSLLKILVMLTCLIDLIMLNIFPSLFSMYPYNFQKEMEEMPNKMLKLSLKNFTSYFEIIFAFSDIVYSHRFLKEKTPLSFISIFCMKLDGNHWWQTRSPDTY